VAAAAWVGGCVILLGLVSTWRLPEPFGSDLDWEER
jgi:putative copper export protein